MTYTQFCAEVKVHGWTADQLLCNVPASDNLIGFMDRVGLARYERYVMRFCKIVPRW